jgi:hypothetical protein
MFEGLQPQAALPLSMHRHTHWTVFQPAASGRKLFNIGSDADATLDKRRCQHLSGKTA